MNKLFAGIIALFLAVVASGCGSLRKLSNGDYYRVDKFVNDPRTNKESPFDLDKICFPEQMSGQTCNNTAYKLAATDKAARNRLQSYLMAGSDTLCAVHASQILNTSTNANLFTGFSALGLGAAAPLIKPVTSKNAFAAAAALATGTRSLFNEEVYKQMLVTTIIKAITDSRDSQATIIHTRQSEGVDTYTVDDAIRDVLQYHDRCSFYRGLVDLSEAIEKKATCSAVASRRDLLVVRLAATGITDDAKKSYLQELDIVNKQIAECR